MGQRHGAASRSACKWWHYRSSNSTSTSTSRQPATLDSLGVMQTSTDLRRLCESPSDADSALAVVDSGPGTPVGFGLGADSPRSSAAVASPCSAEEPSSFVFALDGTPSSLASAQETPNWLRQHLNNCDVTS